MGYQKRTYQIPPELEDELVAELWAEGMLGVETKPGPDGEVVVEAYFLLPAPEPTIWGFLPLDVEILPETDWLARYRESARPFPVGRRLLIDPREPGEEPPAEIPDGRILLRLPARSAFGVGSHESTRLVLEMLEDLPLAGRRVLEVGAGTGVLSFAALLVGARRAVAFDVDPAAPFHARDNGRLNGLAALHFAGTVAALAESAAFDLALVNVIPEEILPELPAVVRRLAPGGELLFSGILVERGAEVLARAAELGLAERGRREAGEWIAFRLGPDREG